MKVLLIRPPYTYRGDESLVKQVSSVGLPLGLLYLGAILEQQNHEVMVFDGIAEDTQIRKIDGGVHFGCDWGDLRKAVKRFNPDWAGVNCLFTQQYGNVIKAGELIRDVNPSIKTVVGGNHPTVCAEDFVDTFDFIVRGEGEETLLELLEFDNMRYEQGIFHNSVRGIAYKNVIEKTVITPPRPPIKKLDELPLPAYHLIDMERYFRLNRKYESRPDYFGSHRSASIITSRGCPQECCFCSIRSVFTRRWRPHSPGYVADHVEHLVGEYGVEHLHIEDDNFTNSPGRVHKIFNELEKRGIRLSFDTPNGTRLDTLDKSLLKRMKDSGCLGVKIAIESGDQDTLDNIIHKNLRLEDAVRVGRTCRELGMPLSSFYIIGFPGETMGKIKRTLEFAYMMAKEYSCRPHFSMAIPIKGTDLRRICEEKNYLVTEPFMGERGFKVIGEANIRTPEFAPEDLERMLKAFYRRLALLYLRRNLNPRSMIGLIRKARKNPELAKRILRIGKGYLE